MDVLHDHCRSCFIKFCDFDIVEDVSCPVVFCMNECGQKLHGCKQADHNKLCLHQQIDCINKQYGCPATFQRRILSRHLDVCPANIQICTSEWNRWHSGSLISKTDVKDKAKQMQNVEVVTKDLDIASAIHDQRILLETIMPSTVLQYYSEISDRTKDEPSVSSIKNETTNSTSSSEELIQNTNGIEIENGGSSEEPEKHSILNNHHTQPQLYCEETKIVPDASVSTSQNDNLKDKIGDHRITTANLIKYVSIAKQNEGKILNGTHARQKTLELQNDVKFSQQAESNSSTLPYNGLFSNHSTRSFDECERSIVEETIAKSSSAMEMFKHLDDYIEKFKNTAPEILSLVNNLDSDVCVAIDVVNQLVNEVVKNKGDDEQLPLIDWQDDIVGTSSAADAESKCDELRRSISDMMQELGVVCDLSIGSSISQTTQEEKRALRKAERRKRRSWLYSSNNSNGGSGTSWGWMPKKEVKDASTDTDDLDIDKSNIEWLSPEASVSSEDLIFRLFSILGASYRGYASLYEKQVVPFISDSSCQTVAPFLLHIDMNAIGRALCSAALSSRSQNHDERRRMLSLLTDGKSEENWDECIKISNNLAFNNLALGSVMESVPRYQTKPSSMYSFMCGCLLRRDQFSSHIQNVHCEIMSGLNGWIEQKCPYAIYGCTYTQPRFCPDHCDNAIIYNQRESSYAVRPGYWTTESNSHRSSDTENYLIDLPYEIHENILQYLDSFSIRQLSLSCTYFREICKEHLPNRGIVDTKWIKRTYDDGTQSWKMGEKIWSFTNTFSKINHWVLPDNLPMVEHVSRCPVVAACDLKYKEEKVKVFF